LSFSEGVRLDRADIMSKINKHQKILIAVERDCNGKNKDHGTDVNKCMN